MALRPDLAIGLPLSRKRREVESGADAEMTVEVPTAHQKAYDTNGVQAKKVTFKMRAIHVEANFGNGLCGAHYCQRKTRMSYSSEAEVFRPRASRPFQGVRHESIGNYALSRYLVDGSGNCRVCPVRRQARRFGSRGHPSAGPKRGQDAPHVTTGQSKQARSRYRQAQATATRTPKPSQGKRDRKRGATCTRRTRRPPGASRFVDSAPGDSGCSRSGAADNPSNR